MMNFLFTTNRGNLTSTTANIPGDELPLTELVSQVAYLTSDVLPGKGGRMHYLSTEWGARSIDNLFIPEGTLVRPVIRKGNTWMVAVDEQAPSHHAA